MEHIIPNTHLGLLQAILRALILNADPEATFASPVVEPEPEPEPPRIGH